MGKGKEGNGREGMGGQVMRGKGYGERACRERS